MDYKSLPPPGRPVARDPYFSLYADASGVGFVHCGDGVLVVPVTDSGHVLLAVERSPAFDCEILTLVCGCVEEGESLEESANRELQEELGWQAKRMDYLGEIRPFKYLTTRQFVFLARELSPGRLPGDEPHPIGVRRVPLDGLVDLCTNGELRDAPTIAGLCLAWRFLQASNGEQAK